MVRQKDIDIGIIDVSLLKKQIKAVNESNLSVEDKEGIHNLLGKILDEYSDPTRGFVITSVHKDDLYSEYEDEEEIDMIKAKIDELTDDDMGNLAGELADSYCENYFWPSLRGLFEQHYYTEEWKKEYSKRRKFEEDIDAKI